MRMREAGVPASTIGNIFWHTSPSITRHYTVAQIVELHAPVEKIKEKSGRWNKSLATLRIEHEEARQRGGRERKSPKVPQQRKTT